MTLSTSHNCLRTIAGLTADLVGAGLPSLSAVPALGNTRRIVRVAITLTLALLWVALCPGRAAAQTAEDFGFGTAQVAGASAPTPALGERPLLTILIEFDDATFPDTTFPPDPASYFRRLLFPDAPGDANLAGKGGFFDENSFGQFRFVNAGVLGPYRAVDNPGTLQLENRRECGTGEPAFLANIPLCGGKSWSMRNGILRAALDGFNFRRYNTNGDSRVAQDELLIFFVLANPGKNGGTNRTLWPEQCVPVSPFPIPLCVGIQYPNIDSDSAATAIVHELGHALGIPHELYGQTLDANLRLSARRVL